MLVNVHQGFRASFPSTRSSLHSPRLLCRRPARLLCLAVLAMLSGCGPAASDHALNQGGHASLGTSPESKSLSQQIPSRPKTLSTSGTQLASPASNQLPSPELPAERAQLPEYLTLPTWMAQALDAPDVSVRLQALDAWVQQGAQAPLDPLLVALDDEEDDVREKAMAIIEWQWAAWQAEEFQAVK
jgi:hypothetical protein